MINNRNKNKAGISMKNLFSCFYENNDDETLKAIWNDPLTLFVFDTNVLLDLYSFSPKNRNTFFQTLDLIKDQLWIPHHVGLEYQRNRIKVVIERRKLFTDLENQIKTINHDFYKIHRKAELYTEETILQKQFKNSSDNTTPNTWQEVLDSLKKNLDFCQQNVKDLDQDQLYPNQHDPIREKLENYFSEPHIGEPLYDNQEELNNFYKDGEERYKHKRPPGYEDIRKGKNSSEDHPTFWFNGLTYQRKFGDLLIFKEIIAHTKDNKLQNVIFISEDKKEDWRVIIDYAGKKNLGARPELKSEFIKETNANNFLILNIEDFVNKTHEHKNNNISKEEFSLVNEHKVFNKSSFGDLSKIFPQFPPQVIKDNIKNNMKYSQLMISQTPFHELKNSISEEREFNIEQLISSMELLYRELEATATISKDPTQEAILQNELDHIIELAKAQLCIGNPQKNRNVELQLQRLKIVIEEVSFQYWNLL